MKATKLENMSGLLRYELVTSQVQVEGELYDTYGIEATSLFEEKKTARLDDISTDQGAVWRLMNLLCDECVTPATFYDIVYDFVVDSGTVPCLQ